MQNHQQGSSFPKPCLFFNAEIRLQDIFVCHDGRCARLSNHSDISSCRVSVGGLATLQVRPRPITVDDRGRVGRHEELALRSQFAAEMMPTAAKNHRRREMPIMATEALCHISILYTGWSTLPVSLTKLENT